MPAARTCFSPCIVCITIARTFFLYAPLSLFSPGNHCISRCSLLYDRYLVGSSKQFLRPGDEASQPACSVGGVTDWPSSPIPSFPSLIGGHVVA
ncbi:hypothetical protein HDV57DRAFT_491941 [Trichoderma longibrachiatum]